MRTVRLYGRSLLRRKVAGTVAVALLVGIGGAAVLGAFAGARRNDSAFPRLIASERTSDLRVSTQGIGVVPTGPIRGLPQVESAEAFRMFILAGRHGNRPIVFDRDLGAATALGSPSSRPLYRSDQVQVLEGRLPDAARADEGMINESFADNSGLGVGDTYDAYLYKLQDVVPIAERAGANGRVPSDAELRPVMTPVRFHITGLARTNGDIVVNEQDSNDTIFVTPAFVRRHQSRAFIGGASVNLHDPAKDSAAFERAVRRTFPDLNLAIDATATQAGTFARVVGPYGDALRIFALVAAVAALFVVGEALSRLVVTDATELETLAALGATRRQRFLSCSLRSTVALVGGACLAVTAAYALSPVFPIGRARDAEPASGLRFDAPVLLLGGLALVLVLLVPIAATAYTRVRRQAAARTRAQFQPSWAASSLARSGAPVGAVTGVRYALQRDRSATGSSLFGTLVGLVAAIMAITAALVFATNLDGLVTSPTRYGWTWDVLIDSYNQEVSPDLLHRAAADHQLTALATGSRASLTIAGHSIPAYGFRQVKGRVALAVTRGRMPRGAHEIALGAETLRVVGRSVGDTITVPTAAGDRLQLKIVGRVLLPSLTVTGTTGLAEGAAVDAAAMRRLDPSAPPAFFLADLAPGASVRSVADRYGREANTFGARRPGDVVAYGNVRSTPLLLAGLLAVLGAGVLAHLLVTSIRQRRRDLALLKTLGFTRRQVVTTVGWFATTLIGLAVLVGIPFGLAAGRWMWRSFADDLGLASVVTIPVAAVLLLVVVAVALANLVAALPARVAARTRPAVVLRSE